MLYRIRTRWEIGVSFIGYSFFAKIRIGHKNKMLTNKQEKYVQELIKGKSQREAYKTSYRADRMKDATIDKRASDLFQKKEVRERYNELIKECVEDAESIRKLIIDTEIAIVKASFGDLFDLEEDEDGYGLVTKPKEDLSNFDMRAVKSYKYSKDGKVMFELYDKQLAINRLMELYKIATEDEQEDISIILDQAEGYEV